MKYLALAVLLVACGQDTEAVLKAPPRAAKGSAVAVAKPIAASTKLAGLTVALPTGWTAAYDDRGSWSFTSQRVPEHPLAITHLAQMSAAVAPSPEDYLALLQASTKDTTSKLVTKQTLPDGFALSLESTLNADPGHGKRATYVVRKLGALWIECACPDVPDDATRDRVIALCSSAKL